MSGARLLYGIDCPADLRKLPREQVEQVASEIRSEILERVSQTGGHLASSLGEGVTQDYKEAKKWFFTAAGQGDAGAQRMLGVMYYNGQGVLQNYRQAKKWHLMAAEQGDAAAQSALGVMYYNGQGVPQDYVQAHMWFNLSAARYDPVFSTKDRDAAVSLRDLVAARMTPDQIAEAQRMAREWKPKTQ